MKFSSTAPVVVRYGNKTKLRKNFRNGEVISNRKDISKNISRRLYKLFSRGAILAISCNRNNRGRFSFELARSNVDFEGKFLSDDLEVGEITLACSITINTIRSCSKELKAVGGWMRKNGREGEGRKDRNSEMEFGRR